MLVLVEGASDANAVRALADLVGCDLDARGVRIHTAGGATNFSRLLREVAGAHPTAQICGMYDSAEEQHVRRALSEAHGSLETLGFFACEADLEDELVRALGADVVERVLEEQGELASFRRFQAMPQHRTTAVEQQLHRFLGTRATRKIRCGRLLVERLDIERMPRPLAQLAARLLSLH